MDTLLNTLVELERRLKEHQVYGFALEMGPDGRPKAGECGVVRTPVLGPDNDPFVIIRMPDGSRKLVDAYRGPGIIDTLKERELRRAGVDRSGA